jgi:putative tricarboxylic transport membrane protein
VIAPALLSLLALSAAFIAAGYGLWDFGAPAAGLMPMAAAILLLAASLAVLRWETPRLTWPQGAWRKASYIGGLLLLVPATSLLGMLGALGLFCFAMLYGAERLPLARAAAIAVAAMMGSWLLFERLLSVPLPKPMIW